MNDLKGGDRDELADTLMFIISIIKHDRAHIIHSCTEIKLPPSTSISIRSRKGARIVFPSAPSEATSPVVGCSPPHVPDAVSM
jgi:hypothetical protein